MSNIWFNRKVRSWKFQKCRRDMKIFSLANFNRRFQIWAQNSKKICISTRGRHFVNFWHFLRGLIRSHSNSTKIKKTLSWIKITKKLPIFLAILPKWSFKISKIARFQNWRKFQRWHRDMIFFSWHYFHRMNRIWPRNWQKFCNFSRERQFVYFCHLRFWLFWNFEFFRFLTWRVPQ